MELFRLLGTIAIGGADEAKNDIDGVTDKAEKSSGKIGKAIGKMGKLAIGAVTAGAAAAGALTKAAIDGYANYEQLVGGVETLFKESGDKVLQYANKAYQTAGLSANAYMETVTSFSASLLQSLGGDTAAAADKADKAITDMSDNANKMGTAMESIQNAYSGFAKQNFTMLDNLKLGYSGTKEEMQRLLDDATKLSGIEYDISSYADIVDAIHVIQEEMGIAGTTAKEASSTISGSASAMKAAWENVLVGLADKDQDMNKLLSNLGDSVLTFGNNIIPRIEQTLNGIGTMIEKIVPPIVQKLPSLILNVLPGLVTAGASIVSALAQAITSALPQLLQVGVDLLLQFLNGFTQNIDSVMTSATEIITTLVNGIAAALPQLIPAAVDAIIAFALALVNPENITMMIESALGLIQALADGILQALPKLTEALPEIIIAFSTAMNENLPQIITVGIEVLIALIDGILQAIPDLIDAIPEIVSAISDTLLQHDWLALGADLLYTVCEGLLSMKDSFIKTVKSILDGNLKVFRISYDTLDKVTGGAVSKITGLWKKNLNLLSGIATTALNAVLKSFNEKMDNAKKIVEGGLNLIKGMFNFEWKLPDIKLPHFSISPAGWKFSDLLEGSIPKLGIEWYAKGGIMTDPTIFGMNGNNLMVGGEAGDEAIAPIDLLQKYIAEAVASQNSGLVAILEKILFAIMSMDADMVMKFKNALEGTEIKWNDRELGRMVKAYA